MTSDPHMRERDDGRHGEALVYRVSRTKAALQIVGCFGVAGFFAGMAVLADLEWHMRLVVALLTLGFFAACWRMADRLRADGPALTFDRDGLTDFQSGIGPIPLKQIVGMEGRRRRLNVFYRPPDLPPDARPKRLTIDIGLLDRPPKEVFARLDEVARTRS